VPGCSFLYDYGVDDGLTYYAALQLMGSPESRLVTLLDAVATAGLTVWAGSALVSGQDAGTPLGILELKNEAVRFGQVIARRVSDWRRGLSRFDRSERLAAAHAVLVISAYFEALGDANLPVAVERLGLTGAEQAALATGDVVLDGYAEVIDFLLRERLPIPEPHRTYAEVRAQLGECYSRLSIRLLKFVAGLAVWDELDARERDALAEAVRGVPGRALGRYDDAYRQLAADNPEFGVWAGTPSDELPDGLGRSDYRCRAGP
jgi:hypothetical protein